MRAPLPDLQTLVAPYIGQPYAVGRCWDVVRQLVKDGLGIDVDADPAQAAVGFQEVWWMGDDCSALSILHPWDLIVIAGGNHISRHVTLAIDNTAFVHANKKVGVCLEPTIRWAPRFLQVARLRSLL